LQRYGTLHDSEVVFYQLDAFGDDRMDVWCGEIWFEFFFRIIFFVKLGNDRDEMKKMRPGLWNEMFMRAKQRLFMTLFDLITFPISKSRCENIVLLMTIFVLFLKQKKKFLLLLCFSYIIPRYFVFQEY
jgi:hypothetical protein